MHKVPDRWLDYKPYGEVIKGTKIVAFKVPLTERISRNLRKDHQFTPAKLLEAFPRLRFIIDLTNTSRYYDGEEFTNVGIRHQKIMTPGRKIPPLDTVKQFFKAMDVFTSTCREDELVGVHCTHGINRTGYFICRYLVQQLGWKVEDSLKAFEEGRGYAIERDIYVNALKTVPQGKKIDTNNVNLVQPLEQSTFNTKMPTKLPREQKNKRPPFRSSPFPFGRPPPAHAGAWPMPPPPGPMFWPRPFRYGPPMRPPMPPPLPPPLPGPNCLLGPGFHPRILGSPRMPRPSRLPGSPSRLLPPKMAPPAPPPPPPPLTSRPLQPMMKHPGQQKPQPFQPRNDMNLPGRASGAPFALVDDPAIIAASTKILNEQDFTVDTFEENLLTPNSG